MKRLQSTSCQALPQSLANRFVFLRVATVLMMLTGLFAIATSSSAQEASQQTQWSDWFESRIRPVLIERCMDCHAVDTEASGGLVLDSQAGWAAGGDSGQAIKPGDAEGSLLMRGIEYADPNLQMPPDGRLSDAVIEDFRKWIQGGAIDPRQATGLATPDRQTGLPVERAEEHWSYRPVGATPIDRMVGAIEPTSAIDYWIDQKLSDAELAPYPEAQPLDLLRRLHFDLNGLPPSAEQIAAFVDDTSPGAYERRVDELLETPQFGETFARHWLDVARYAESITLRGFVLPQAWRYRNYVIDAYNADRPFNEMIREQLAGDLLSADSTARRREQLIATGFLALGNTNLEQQDKEQLEMDFIDEQLEVLGRAFLGQTIGCARCHDHKFDPIPTRDYYALAGILRSGVAMEHANVSKWIERPLPLSESEAARFDAMQADRDRVAESVRQTKAKLNRMAKQVSRLVSVSELDGIVIDDRDATLVGEWKPSAYSGRSVGAGYIHDLNKQRGSKTATFEPHDLPPGEYKLRMAYAADKNRASNALVKVFSAEGEQEIRVNQQQSPDEDGLWITLGTFRFEPGGQAYVLLSNEGANGHVIADAIQFLPQFSRTGAEQASLLTDNDASATGTGKETGTGKQDSSSDDEKRRLEAELKHFEAELKRHDERLAERPHYLAIVEGGEPKDIPIHIRGDVHNLGQTVPRGVLTAVRVQTPIAIDDSKSGRLELADWISCDSNPLTARVYVNRVWSWLMGRGIVSTVNNFGTTGAQPTHAELLDHLASEFVKHNWSTKQLVRKIVLSQAYRRASNDATAAGSQADIDPDNQLYWRGRLRRLSVEALRDSMLAASGELELVRAESTIRDGVNNDYSYHHDGPWRSIYHPVFRNSLPELYEAFDFANPSVSVGQRTHSTVATQALVLLNHPWVVERARAMAQRYAETFPLNEMTDERLRGLTANIYVDCFSRQPTELEIDNAIAFLCDSQSGDERDDAPTSEVYSGSMSVDESRLSQLIHAMFASVEFRYLR